MNKLKRVLIILSVLVLFITAIPATIVMAEDDTPTEPVNPNLAKIHKLNASMFAKELKLFSAEERAWDKLDQKWEKFESKLRQNIWKEEDRQDMARFKIASMDASKRAAAIAKEVAKSKKVASSLAEKSKKFIAKMIADEKKVEVKSKAKETKFYSGWNAKLAKLNGGRVDDYCCCDYSDIDINFDYYSWSDYRNSKWNSDNYFGPPASVVSFETRAAEAESRLSVSQEKLAAHIDALEGRTKPPVADTVAEPEQPEAEEEVVVEPEVEDEVVDGDEGIE